MVVVWWGSRGLPLPVRLDRLTPTQQGPGMQGETAMPTAAVVCALLSRVALVQRQMSGHKVYPMYGVQPHPLLIGDALGLNYSWYEAPAAHNNGKRTHTP